MAVGRVRRRHQAGLDEQAADRQQRRRRRRAARPPARRRRAPSGSAGVRSVLRWRRRSPPAIASLTTAQPTSATTANAPRSRPHRSVLPPIVSSKRVAADGPDTGSILPRPTASTHGDDDRSRRRAIRGGAARCRARRGAPRQPALGRERGAHGHPGCPQDAPERNVRRRRGAGAGSRRRRPARGRSSTSSSSSIDTQRTSSTSRLTRNEPERRCIAQKRTCLLRPLRSRYRAVGSSGPTRQRSPVSSQHLAHGAAQRRLATAGACPWAATSRHGRDGGRASTSTRPCGTVRHTSPPAASITTAT